MRKTGKNGASPADAHWFPVYPTAHKQLNVPEEVTVQDPSFLQGLGKQGVEVDVGVVAGAVVGGGTLQVVPVYH